MEGKKRLNMIVCASMQFKTSASDLYQEEMIEFHPLHMMIGRGRSRTIHKGRMEGREGHMGREGKAN